MRTTCVYCDRVPKYVVKVKDGHYAVKVAQKTPQYCRGDAYSVADQLALSIRYGTSAHISLQDRKEKYGWKGKPIK